MKQSRKKSAIYALLLLLALMPFQNCAEPFSTEDTFASLGNSSGDLVVPPQDGGDTGSEEQPAPPVEEIPPVVNPTPTPSPAPTPGMRMVFMATGHQARTIMSCDDGLTWINDRSDNPNARCWVDGSPNYVECDHTPTSGRNIDAADGWFYTNYGWGYPGTARRSRDGINWEVINSNRHSIGITISPNGLLTWFSNTGDYPVSNNLGQSWSMTSARGNYFMGRSLARVGNRIWISSDDESSALYSADGGLTIQPMIVPNLSRDIKAAEGNGVIVILSSKIQGGVFTSYAIHSTNGGQSWSSQVLYSGMIFQNWSDIIFDGTQFVTWAGNRRYTSTNGVNWTSSPVSISVGVIEGSIAYNPNTRTYVHISNRWGSYYANQRAFRSSDGINWTQLSTQAFPGGHPISKIISAPMESRFCP